MNICFSLTNLELGGAQVFVIRLANAIALQQNKSVYVYDHNPEYRNENIIANISNNVKIVSYCESKTIRFFVWKINALCKKINPTIEFKNWLNKKRFEGFVKKNNIQIVNSHMAQSDFIISECKGLFKIVNSLHGEYELSLSESGNMELVSEKIKKSLNRSNGIIYSADKNITQVYAIKNKLTVPVQKIYVGFSDKTFIKKNISKKNIGIPENAYTIGMIARGIPEKGWKAAIDVVIKLNSKLNKKVYLLCIGDGDYLKNLIKSENNPFIVLKQFTTDFQDYFSYYSVFDLFLFPTEFKAESVPNVIIESLYWKKPIIASDHAEIKNMLTTSSSRMAGSVVSMINGRINIEELEKTVFSYITNPSLSKEAVSNSSNAFEKFEMETIVNKYLKLFKTISE